MADRIVQLPPGCQGIEVGGKTYRGRGPGQSGYARVPEEHARLIDGVDTGGIVTGSAGTAVGTRNGRWCASCKRLWNCWNATCPKCRQPTIPEAEMPAQPAAVLPSSCC